MFRLIFVVFALCMLVFQAPDILARFSQAGADVRAAHSARPAATPASQPTRVSGRKAVIAADRRGHYATEAKINGRRINVLVDTGATAVAINEQTARKVGLRLRRSDFIHTASTANGQVKFASAVVDEIRIDRVRVRDVQVAVLPDESLNNVLLGMSFLNKLRSFQVRDGELILQQ